MRLVSDGYSGGDGWEKLPPHSIEAEMCLLGSLMLCDSDKSLYASVRSIVSREHFYQADHQIIFDILCKMHDGGEAIDAITLVESLKQRKLLDEIGGNPYIAQILNKVPSSAHAEHYARIVCEKSKWREAIRLSNDILREAYAPHDDFDSVDTCLGKMASEAAKIATSGRGGKVFHVADVLPEILGRRTSGEIRREPTGLERLDHYIGGLAYGEKTIIGGKPSMGKSAVIKKLAKNLAATGMPVGIVSVEEQRQKIVTNLLSGEADVPNNRIEFNTATPEEWNEVEFAAQRLREMPMYLVDSARKISGVIAMVHVLVSKYGCRAVFVDHLHIIDPEANKYDNRNVEISKISAELKWAWKDLQIIGVEAAQLNRAGGNERPTLSSLRDSGTLEADADTVILLHREDYYHRTEPHYHRDNTLELILAKNKHGATATIPVYYNDARYDIRDMRQNEMPSIPDPTEGMFVP